VDEQPSLPAGASISAVRAEVAAHAITSGTLMRLYRR